LKYTSEVRTSTSKPVEVGTSTYNPLVRAHGHDLGFILFQLLKWFRICLQLDSEDSYTIFLYGGGALVAVYLLSVVIGAIDSIPVVW